MEVELLEDRSMLSGVSFLQMPLIDTHAGAVLNDFRAPGPPAALALADLNGDGRLDIIIIGPNTSTDPYYPSHQLVCYVNNGGATPSFTAITLSIGPRFPGAGDIIDVTSVAAMDVNKDGLVDLVITYTDTNPMITGEPFGFQGWGRVAWLENTGNLNAPFIPHFISSADYGFAPVISIQDVNGDGRPDIVVSGYFANQPGMLAPTWWDNAAGNGTVWVQHPFNGQGPNLSWAFGHLNGTGYVDSVMLDSRWPHMPLDDEWVENKGPGQPAIPHPINATIWGIPVIGDVNGDGRLDIVYLSQDGLGWLENIPGPVTVTTKDIAPPTVNPGQTAAVLRLDVTNNGLTTIDFRSVGLLFAEPAGLTGSTPTNLTANVSIYRDTGSGQFNPADPLVGSASNVSLLSTALQLQLAASNSSSQIVAGRTASFFVVIQLASTTSMQSQGFEVAWMPQGSSLVDDASGLGLAFEIPGNLSSSLVLVPGTGS